MKVSKNPIIVAGLVGILSLGIVGCSASSSSTTTVETSVSDENGTTTTTTTQTTTSSENGTTTSENVTTADNSTIKSARYENEYYGIGFKLPEGFEAGETTSDNDSEIVCYYATDGKASEAKIVLQKDIAENMQGVTDDTSWAKAYAEAYQADMERIGEQDIQVSSAVGKIGAKENIPAVHFESKDENGNAIYRDIFFVMDNEGSGLRILLRADSEQTLEALRAGLGSIG